MEIIYEETLEQTADSIEALSQDVFACATYQLLERESEEVQAERTGSVMMYIIEDDHVVKRLQTLKTNAILDMKWHRTGSQKMLTTADSKGEVHFYSEKENMLVEKALLVVDENVLCLSADWYRNTDNPEKVAYSMSSGDLALVQLVESEPVVVKTWKAHSLEAWIIACDYANSDVFYSGADDCLLKIWDLRTGVERACITSKRHSMGVCSIQAHPTREHIFCSGSYDELVYVWDNRTMKCPISEIATGGGVWRLKWHPHGKDQLLAACMHNGYKVIGYNNGGLNNPAIELSYEKHKSLAYGVDWCLGLSQTNNGSCKSTAGLIASCSFYDNLLTVWKTAL